MVGRPARLLAGAIAEYEARAARYWNLEVVEVKEERAGKGSPVARVLEAEGERLMQRVAPGAEIVALTRTGARWSSKRLAQEIEERSARGRSELAFIIGGAFGLAPAVLERAAVRLSLSPLTLTHELARLVLAEQLYRAGTIVRGEPYHKAEE